MDTINEARRRGVEIEGEVFRVHFSRLPVGFVEDVFLVEAERSLGAGVCESLYVFVQDIGKHNAPGIYRNA